MLFVPFMGSCWHWRYGDFVYYGQWKIRVAPSFYVRKDAAGLSLWKLSFGYSVWHGADALIGIRELRRPFQYEDDYPRFLKGADMAAENQGYKFLSAKEIRFGTGTSHCLEYGALKDVTKSFVQCAVEDTSLTFSYGGHTKYIPVLFSTIQSIQHIDSDR